MAKKLKLKFPWAETKPGEGFFIPCVNTEAVKARAARAALEARVFDYMMDEGIKDGKWGVLFRRRRSRFSAMPPESLSHTQAEPDAAPAAAPASQSQ